MKRKRHNPGASLVDIIAAIDTTSASKSRCSRPGPGLSGRMAERSWDSWSSRESRRGWPDGYASPAVRCSQPTGPSTGACTSTRRSANTRTQSMSTWRYSVAERAALDATLPTEMYPSAYPTSWTAWARWVVWAGAGRYRICLSQRMFHRYNGLVSGPGYPS